MNKAFDFLFATRFWSMVIAAVAIYAQSKGWLGDAEMLLIATITAGFTIVRTIDRATEQKILAAAVSSGEIPASSLIEIPPSKTDTLASSTIKTK